MSIAKARAKLAKAHSRLLYERRPSRIHLAHWWAVAWDMWLQTCGRRD